MTVQDISPVIITTDGPDIETQGTDVGALDVTAQAFARVATIRAHGTFVQRFLIPNLTPSSTLFVSITELDGAGNPFVGSAVMRVDNVAPDNGGVTIRAEVGWSADLTVRLNFFVF